jgi:hypothetical protein
LKSNSNITKEWPLEHIK